MGSDRRFECSDPDAPRKACKSQTRWGMVPLSPCKETRGANQVDATTTPSMTWHTRQLTCSTSSSFQIFGNQDVLCNFVIFIIIVIFCTIKLRITVIHCNKRVFVLWIWLPFLMFSSDSTCSRARFPPNSMLNVSRCYMVFDIRLGRPTSDRNNNAALLNLDRFVPVVSTSEAKLRRSSPCEPSWNS